MNETLLEAGVPITARSPDSTIFWHEGRSVTVGEMLGDARELSSRLPDRGALLNACGSRYAFLVGFVACLLRGRPCLLPGERTPQRLAALCEAYADSHVLTDAAGGRVSPFAIEVAVLTGACERNPDTLVASGDATTVAFTSGSTGEPRQHARGWRSQAQQIDAVARRFGLDGSTAASVVATVPHGHMYGFEWAVLLPLRANMTVHAGTPLYPDDVRRALETLPSPRVLVTSPVHLRALARARSPLPPLKMVVSATAPLSNELAASFEESASTEVHEVYGCTEAGSVASRRTVEDGRWTPFFGLSVCAPRGDSARFHVTLPCEPEPIPLHDVLALEDDGRFQLLGRIEDMIKVGGKRASLAGLNRALLGIEGVEDGVFVMPEHLEQAGAVRPVAIVVAPTLTSKLVLDELRRRIDLAFVPRRVIMTDALPRDAVGKLTKAQVSNLLASAPSDEVTTPITFPADHPSLAGHFPGRPIVPGVVVLDAVAAQAREAFRLGPLDAVIQAKFLGAVQPGASGVVRLRRRAPCRVAFDLRLNGELVSSGELSFREGLT